MKKNNNNNFVTDDVKQSREIIKQKYLNERFGTLEKAINELLSLITINFHNQISFQDFFENPERKSRILQTIQNICTKALEFNESTEKCRELITDIHNRTKELHNNTYNNGIEAYKISGEFIYNTANILGIESGIIKLTPLGSFESLPVEIIIGELLLRLPDQAIWHLMRSSKSLYNYFNNNESFLKKLSTINNLVAYRQRMLFASSFGRINILNSIIDLPYLEQALFQEALNQAVKHKHLPVINLLLKQKGINIPNISTSTTEDIDTILNIPKRHFNQILPICMSHADIWNLMKSSKVIYRHINSNPDFLNMLANTTDLSAVKFWTVFAVRSGRINLMVMLLSNPVLKLEDVTLIIGRSRTHGAAGIFQILVSQLSNDQLLASLKRAIIDNYLKIAAITLDYVGPSKLNLNDHNPSLFCNAVEHGHLDIIKLMLAKIDGIKTLDDDILSPISLAVTKNRLDIVEALIEASPFCDINQALVNASHHGALAIVKKILSVNGINLDAQYTSYKDYKDHYPYKQTALYAAARKGHIEIVKMLLLHGADHTLRANNHTPLMIAIKKNHDAIAIELLSVSALDEQQETLSLAARYGSLTILNQMLTTKGLKVFSRDLTNGTPFLNAIKSKSIEKVHALLQYYGEDKSLDISNDDYTDILLTAATYGCGNIIDIITQRLKPSIEQATEGLCEAIYYSQLGAVMAFLRHKVDFLGWSNRISFSREFLPLLHTAISSSTDIFNIILQAYIENDIDLNIYDWKKRTPLHYAIIQGRLMSASELLKCSNIDLNTIDEEGSSPLLAALQYKQKGLSIELTRRCDPDFVLRVLFTAAEKIETLNLITELDLLSQQKLAINKIGLQGITLLDFIISHTPDYQQANLNYSNFSITSGHSYSSKISTADTIKYLLRHGADSAHISHSSAKISSEETVRLLMLYNSALPWRDRIAGYLGIDFNPYLTRLKWVPAFFNTDKVPQNIEVIYSKLNDPNTFKSMKNLITVIRNYDSKLLLESEDYHDILRALYPEIHWLHEQPELLATWLVTHRDDVLWFETYFSDHIHIESYNFIFNEDLQRLRGLLSEIVGLDISPPQFAYFFQLKDYVYNCKVSDFYKIDQVCDVLEQPTLIKNVESHFKITLDSSKRNRLLTLASNYLTKRAFDTTTSNATNALGFISSIFSGSGSNNNNNNNNNTDMIGRDLKF